MIDRIQVSGVQMTQVINDQDRARGRVQVSGGCCGDVILWLERTFDLGFF